MTFDYEATEWEKRANSVVMIGDAPTTPIHEATLAGKRAYAYRQAAIRRDMRAHCETVWEGLSEKLLTMENYNALVMVEAPADVLNSTPAPEDGSSLMDYISTIQ